MQCHVGPRLAIGRQRAVVGREVLFKWQRATRINADIALPSRNHPRNRFLEQVPQDWACREFSA